MIKKKFIFIIDILTAILLLLQMESLTLYILERLDSLGGRTLFSILAYYQCEGVILDISFSPVGKIFILAVFILFSMNFVVVIFNYYEHNICYMEANRVWISDCRDNDTLSLHAGLRKVQILLPIYNKRVELVISKAREV